MQQAAFKIVNDGGVPTLRLYGDWRTLFLGDMQRRLARVTRRGKMTLDLSDIATLDSAGVYCLILAKRRAKHAGFGMRIIGLRPEFRVLFRLVYAKRVTHEKQPKRVCENSLVNLLGKQLVKSSRDFFAYCAFLGELIVSFTWLFSKGNFRFGALIKQVETVSVRALPIVALSAFLIGIVVTYQGALQLEKFGASIFTVDLLGVSATRELAPLLTAIVIAGRSGASFTSEIGVMQITEEVDAMRTIGFQPYYFLVIPRILAMVLSLWLVIFFADIIALIGGMVICNAQLGIGYVEFLNRLHETLALRHPLLGFLKAPFFAFLIASIGVFRGLQVSKNTESIGIMTTKSVVNSIFAVIACDAVFSIVFSRLGI